MMNFNHLVESYVEPFANNSRNLIHNVDSSISVISGEEFQFPMSLNQREYTNSYVCSPYTALVPYAKHELRHVKSSIFRIIMRAIIPLVALYLKKQQVNQIVHINNWLLSTNLYPEKWQADDLSDILRQVTNRHRQHAIAFRSLNRHSNSHIMRKFEKSHFLMIPSRQVYIYDIANHDYRSHHNYKIDLNLLEKTNYRIGKKNTITKSEMTRIVELYNMLYIDKYSFHNPQFSTEYLRTIISLDCFELEVFRSLNDDIDAVGGRFIIDNVVTLPIVGYDTTKPQSLGLYRLVLAATLKRANEKNWTFNASSGASGFKMLRGGKPFIEYSAVYVAHLSPSKQKMWCLIKKCLDRWVVPVMEKYKL